jgi:hypothetical protein
VSPAKLSGSPRIEIDQQETSAIQQYGNAGMQALEEPAILDDDMQSRPGQTVTRAEEGSWPGGPGRGGNALGGRRAK